MLIDYTLIQNSSTKAPVIHCFISLIGFTSNVEIPLLIDTGASRTAIPEEQLWRIGEVYPIRIAKTFDFNRNKFDVPIYLANIKILDHLLEDVEIIGTQNKSHGLLGRDILSHFTLLCDGPNERFELY